MDKTDCITKNLGPMVRSFKQVSLVCVHEVAIHWNNDVCCLFFFPNGLFQPSVYKICLSSLFKMQTSEIHAQRF